MARQPDGPPPPPTVQKLRIRYAKRGRLRFASHRDLARTLERALRRAQVPMAFSAGFSRFFSFLGGTDGVIDERGITLVLHYSLVELPDGSYQPRTADDRVGHFLSVVKDFSKDGPETAFVRMVETGASQQTASLPSGDR